MDVDDPLLGRAILMTQHRPTTKLYQLTGQVIFMAMLMILSVGLMACFDDDDPEDPAEETPPPSVLTESEAWRIYWDGPQEPLPFQELFELSLEIVDAASGESASGLEVEVDLRVQGTTARMPTRPTVESSGEGRFNVSGLLFHVPRRWELIIDVHGPSGVDRGRVEFDAVGLYDGELPEDLTGYFSDDDLRHILAMSPPPPPPPDPTNAVADDDDAAHLGQFLFFDDRFSDNGNIACATCHAAEHGFSDPEPLSRGIGQTSRRSMPSLQAAYHRWGFWDGRVDSLWAQALQPIEDENEHGLNRTRLAHLIYADDELRQAYESIFSSLPPLDDGDRFPGDARPIPDDPDHPHNQNWMAMDEDDRFAVDQVFANFGKAIAAYQRRLVRNEAPFDRFVEGLRSADAEAIDALTEEAQRGLQLFVDKGKCVDCHGGTQMTNLEFHNLGLAPREWMPDQNDPGRSAGLASLTDRTFTAAGPHSDDPDGEAARLLDYLVDPAFATDGAFKTPGLRNVADRAPYMHGGHLGTLAEVVDFYSDLQEDPSVGIRDPLLQQVNLDQQEVEAIVEFLEHLSGDPLPQELVTQPESPLR
jgi:cytochrome c peroxidase